MALPRVYSNKFVLVILLSTVQLTLSVKTNARPVYEIINEQSKAEERLIKTSAVASLPYGNPLAGNSQQNARIHAHNQQAMFNAERVRQHKAQLQRWMKTPQLVNNYMRAYHESQENHQLALEQQQADQNDDIPKQTERTREPPKRPAKDHGDTTKLPKSDAVKPERKRNHRSYGSVDYQTVYVPSTMYNQGLKPNIINEMAHAPITKLYDNMPRSTEFVYSKYYPAQEYQSVQNIETLNSLLNKNPGDQLTGFNALLNSPKVNTLNHDKDLEAPINLYFYLKGPSKSSLPDHTRYAPVPTEQESYSKEYTPIKELEENVDETEDALKYKVRPILEQSRYTNVPATENIKYMNPELTNQVLSAGYNPLYQEEEYKIREEDKRPIYQALQYDHRPLPHDQNGDNSEGDQSQRYLYHNSHKGIQHLAQDGTGVSAYDDENLSYAASYEFGYRVHDTHSGNDFGHQEEKKGEETSGQYHVLLPDGRMQSVKYSAGPEGFHADISYDGRK